ncbi:MAG: non-homologous end-joining DNA ligase [Gammaproteobacteria bacterium]
MSLKDYQRKRDFRKTTEPEGGKRSRRKGNLYIIQKHDARRPHYDFRLELDGALKSWAVPKGPSLDPGEKRLAVQVEDHPLAYGEFEGIIPKGQYGGGTVMLWDRGRWEGVGDIEASFRHGKLKFELSGEKLRGRWTLVRMGGKATSQGKNWLLIKEKDDIAGAGSAPDVLKEQPQSVKSGRSMDEIAAAEDRVWKNGQSAKPRKKKTGGDRTPRTSGSKKGNTRTSPHADTRAAELANARKRDMPRDVKPQLAILVKEAPKGDGWLHEIKFDGYRLLCAISNRKARLITRNGHDWTRKFPRIAAAAADLHMSDAWLDGELVAMKASGVSDFQTLQNALKQGADAELAYYIFDLPFCDGHDLTRTPLIERKRLLRQLLSTSDAGPLRYSDHLQGEGGRMYGQACSHALEGIISKRADSPYQSRRARTWVKIKCMRAQEFVVCGYTDPAGSRKYFGALLLGYHDPDGRLVYCGRVGTGFDSKSLKAVHELLSADTQNLASAGIAEGFRQAWRVLGAARSGCRSDLRELDG